MGYVAVSYNYRLGLDNILLIQQSLQKLFFELFMTEKRQYVLSEKCIMKKEIHGVSIQIEF